MSLAVLAIAACSKEDAITEGGKSQQLNVLTSIQTRSAIDGTVMPVGSGHRRAFDRHRRNERVYGSFESRNGRPVL